MVWLLCVCCQCCVLVDRCLVVGCVVCVLLAARLRVACLLFGCRLGLRFACGLSFVLVSVVCVVCLSCMLCMLYGGWVCCVLVVGRVLCSWCACVFCLCCYLFCVWMLRVSCSFEVYV